MKGAPKKEEKEVDSVDERVQLAFLGRGAGGRTALVRTPATGKGEMNRIGGTNVNVQRERGGGPCEVGVAHQRNSEKGQDPF